MFLEVKVKLKKPWLGESTKDERGIRKLRRKGGLVHADTNLWRAQFSSAIKHLKMPAEYINAIRLPDGVECDSLHLHRRTFSRTHVELFECFATGTEVTFKLKIDTSVTPCPGHEEVGKILHYVGKNLGLSQFGSKFGYGRFKVMEINKL